MARIPLLTSYGTMISWLTLGRRRRKCQLSRTTFPEVPSRLASSGPLEAATPLVLLAKARQRRHFRRARAQLQQRILSGARLTAGPRTLPVHRIFTIQRPIAGRTRQA